MRSYSLVTKVGNIRSGETDSVWLPNPLHASARGAVLLHGSSAPANYTDLLHYGANMLAGLIALDGIPCVAGAMSGQSFGNDASMTDIDNAVDYLADESPIDPSKVHLVGCSMGAFVGLRYAIENPQKVASFTGLIPLCDLIAAYNNNTLGLRAQIGTAWGVTYPTALPAAANISSSAAALAATVPCQFYYAQDDAVVPAASVSTMVATTGGQGYNLGNSGGHNEPSLIAAMNLGGTVSARQIIDFMHENG